MADILSKYGMPMPLPSAAFAADPAPADGAATDGSGVIDAVKETASKLNPFNLVDAAGNFALRAVVVIVATGLIMLGFYFMFQSNIKGITKAVLN